MRLCDIPQDIRRAHVREAFAFGPHTQKAFEEILEAADFPTDEVIWINDDKAALVEELVERQAA